MVRTFAAILATTALAACAAGPAYHRPAPPVSAAAPFLGGEAPGLNSAAAPADGWWQLYDDPVLNRLVTSALAANTDLRVALANLEKARAQLRGARGDRLPQAGLSASGSYRRAAVSQVPAGAERQDWALDGGLSLNYELDLFGRVRRNIEAARADREAAAEDVAAVRIAVVADTVRAYVDAAASAQRIAVAHQTVDLLDHALRITQARYEAGRTDRLDIFRVTALRDQQSAQIPDLEADRARALLRLATLTGRPPRDLPAEAGAALEPPRLAKPIPVGDGRSLIARRPDVRAAERRLAADTARIGVASADLYPRVTLGGSIGLTSVGTADLLGAGPFRWLMGPLISWAFPNQAAIRARIGAARADAQADLARFDGTVLTALEETEAALATYRQAALRQQALTTAREAAARAATVALARQREGQIDTLAVLDAERTLAGAQSDLAEASRSVALAQVGLFRALGGGWQAQ